MVAIKTLPIGSIVKDKGTKYFGKEIAWRIVDLNHAGYPANSITLIADKGLDIKAKGSSGNYTDSALRSWLNADAATWAKSAEAASAENPYNTEVGFLMNFSQAFKNALLTTTVISNGLSGSNTNDKVFIPSTQEMGFTTSYSEGTPISYFNSEARRIAQLTPEALANSDTQVAAQGTITSPWHWWLRTGDYSSNANAGASAMVDKGGGISRATASYGEIAVRPMLNISSETEVSATPDADGAYVLFNQPPTLTLATENNKTLYENDTFTINGSAADPNNGDAVTIKYQIDSGTVRNLDSKVSNGSTAIPFTKTLTFVGGLLKDGTTELTSVLNKDIPHVLSVWAEDDKGGKSSIQTRNFYVVPNRPPTLTVYPVSTGSELIKSSILTISGTVSDADNNNVTVSFKLNDGEVQQVRSGAPGDWTFNLLVNDLKKGNNTLFIEVVDSYNAKISKVLTIKEIHNAVPLNRAVAMYEVELPTGNATKFLLWVEHLIGDLDVTAEVSMTNEGEPENFISLPETNLAPKNSTIQEEEFAYNAGATKTKVIFRLTYSRNDPASTAVIKKISGVLS